MPAFEIEQFELHVATYKVEADDEADAIAKVLDGDGEQTGVEYVQVAEDLGLPVDAHQELADALRQLGVTVGNVVRSIRSVARVI